MHPSPTFHDTGLRLQLWRTPVPVCGGQGAHRHDFFTLMFVEAGHGQLRIDGQRLDVAPGHVCWLAPGQEHDASGLEGVTAWALAFHTDVVERAEAEPLLLTGPPRHPWLLPFVLAVRHRCNSVVLPPALNESWRAWLIRLEDELETQPPGHRSAARALLMLLLLDVARQVSPGAAEPGLEWSELLEAVFRFIEQHFRRPIGLRDVARAVSRSPAYLTDRVRRETGRPILAWLTERRMAEARHLLWSSDLTTEQVASRSGFGDPRHFARQFRRLHGMPPQAWRTAQRAAEWGPGTNAERSKETPRTPKSRAL